MNVTLSSRSSQRGTRRVLNGLVAACYDDMRVQAAASRAVIAGERQHRLEDHVQRRATFIHELGELIEDLGGTARERGSVVELALDSLQRVRHLVIGKHTGDAYTACARVEGKTEDLYEGAMAGGLPDYVRLVVERQHAEISSNSQEFRRLRIT